MEMTDDEKIPERKEMDERYQWDLSPMYGDMNQVEREMDELSSEIPGLSSFRGTLKDAERIAEAIRTTDDMSRRLEKIFTYAHLMHDSDLRRQDFQMLHKKAVNLLTRFESESSFMVPEILQLPMDELRRLRDSKTLRFARVQMREIIRRKEHFLSPEEERLLAMADDALETPSRTFTMLNDADITLPRVKDEAGNEIELSHSRYGVLMRSRNRDVRKNAFSALYSFYGSHINTFASLLEGELRKRRFLSRARNYDSCLEASLDADEVTTDVYTSLISAVRSHLPSMYRYLDTRRRGLKIDKVHMYDIHAPLVPEFERKITYREAWRIVREALEPLGNEVASVLDKAESSGWIDVYENRGKRSGAYSSGCYDSPPYILLNYEGRLDDIFTLAHELGHSIHTYLANRNQPHITADYRIFVAEVASTVNENLLLSHLSDKWTSKAERAHLTEHHIDSFAGTVFRQTMFARFEKKVSEMVERDEPLTAEGLSGTYMELVREHFGPSVHADDEISMEWARIPHFYYNFYVYKYATGFSAASAITSAILGGDLDVDDYLGMLKAGGSEPPLELLRRVNIDLTEPSTLNRGLVLFDGLVNDLDGML